MLADLKPGLNKILRVIRSKESHKYSARTLHLQLSGLTCVSTSWWANIEAVFQAGHAVRHCGSLSVPLKSRENDNMPVEGVDLNLLRIFDLDENGLY